MDNMNYLSFNTELIPAVMDGRKTMTRRRAEIEGGCPYGQTGDKFAIVENIDGLRVYTGENGVITGTRLERAQEISEDDARAEGISKNIFPALWNSIYGQGAWDRNPFVWVISFIKSPE